MRRFLSLLLLMSLSFAVVACGSDDPEKIKEKEEAKLEKASQAKVVKVDPICPQVAVVRELDTFRDFGNETPTPDQLVAGAKMVSITGDCSYTKKNDVQGVDVAFNANIIAQRGPKLGGNRISLPIFVAVVDPAGKILNKNQMSAEIKFNSDQPIQNSAEALHVFIPLAKDKRITGPYYQVLAGFQLSPTQVEQAKAIAKKH